jgi:iron complex outermembrane receptor protein
MAHGKHLPIVSLLALGMAAPAIAQVAEPPATPPARAAQAGGGRDIVVVTANKREESVQDIAVAVTALTSEAKQELGVISVTDLTNVTPGLSYTPGNERVTLRGIGRLSNSFGADPGVANYNDGIYTGFAIFAGKDPLLVDRVEVLRGPQGTLYGRNSIGGAINTISKRPTEEFEADAVFAFGNYGAVKTGVAVSGPINDSLRYRLLGFKEKREGIDTNYGTGKTEGWEINDHFLEAHLEGEIGDRLSFWLKVADSHYDKAGPPGGRTATFSTAPYLPGVYSAGGLSPRSDFAYGNPNVLSYTQGGYRTDNPFATSREHSYNQNFAATATLPQYDEAIVEAIYEAGPFDIKYTGGYTFYNYELVSDPDGTPIQSVTYRASPTTFAPSATGTVRTIYPDVTNFYGESRSLFSNEINLISTHDGPLQWIAGVYQYQENSDQPGQVQYLKNEPLASTYVDTVLGVVQNPDRMLQKFRNVSLFNAYGVYGQADYEFSDQWKLTLGLRYSKDNKQSAEEGFVACYLICGAGIPYLNYSRIAYGALAQYFDAQGVAHRRLNGNWQATTGTAGLEYRPLDDTLLFAKYSRGYKAGGFNNLGFAALPYTDPEFVDSYEGGWKQEWADWGLTTNAAAFFYKYTDVQSPLTVVNNPGQTGSTSFTAFVNVPEVETMGFELEGNWNPIDPLNIGFTYAYLDTEITESAAYADPTRATADPLRTRTLVGNKLAQSPPHKVALNASYNIPLAGGSRLLPTMSYSWRDKFYDSFFNNPNEESPAYDNFDARLNWYSPDDRFQITAWVRNAFDSEQTTSITAQAFRTADAGRYQTYSFAPPRMFGIDLLFHWR